MQKSFDSHDPFYSKLRERVSFKPPPQAVSAGVQPVVENEHPAATYYPQTAPLRRVKLLEDFIRSHGLELSAHLIGNGKSCQAGHPRTEGNEYKGLPRSLMDLPTELLIDIIQRTCVLDRAWPLQYYDTLDEIVSAARPFAASSKLLRIAYDEFLKVNYVEADWDSIIIA